MPGRTKVTKELDRSLGFWSVYAIALGAMMGSGIFVLPGLAAAQAGPLVAISYLIAGLFVLPAVFSKAELATAMPVAGGTYVYIDRAMGPWWGTITGLGTWFSQSAKTAFAFVALGAYIVLFTSVPPMWVTMGLLAALLAINILGAGKVKALQVVIVLVTVAALLGYAALASPHYKAAHFVPVLPHGVAGVLAAAGFVFVAYSGVTKVCAVSEEIKNPTRNIPLGMLAAQFTVMLLYVIMSLVMVAVIPMDELSVSLTPLTLAAEHTLGKAGVAALAVVAILGLISLCNAGILASTRFPFAMARDMLLPRPLDKVDERFGTPVPAILLTGALLFALITMLPVESLAKLASGFKIFIFAVVNLAVIVLRETGARWYKPRFKSPLYPWMQIVGILGGMVLLIQLGPFAGMGVVGALVLGSAWFLVYARSRVNRRGALQHLVGEARALRATELAELAEARPDDRPRVLVPVFGGEPAPERLVRLASAFLDRGVLEVIRFEEVPEQAPLSSFLDSDATAEHLAAVTQAVGEDAHVDVEFHDVVTHNAKEALNHHALARQAEWMVMEWPSHRELHFLVRHPFAWWADHSPCDLAIFLDRGGPHDGDTSDDYPRIFVLAEPGPYDSLVVHVADRLARQQRGGRVTLYNCLRSDASASHRAEVAAYQAQLAQLCHTPPELRIDQSSDRYGAMRKASEEFDLLVLGAPKAQPLRTLFLGSREHRVAESVRCSVLKVRAPRHKVHDRMIMPREFTEERSPIEAFLSSAVLLPRLKVEHKAHLFALLGAHVAVQLGVEPTLIEQSLWAREQQQNTALAEGVALSAPIVSGLPGVSLALCTLPQPIDYRAPGKPRVDVVIVVFASPANRQLQLSLTEQLNRMLMSGRLLPGLRVATTDVELVAAVHQSRIRLDG